MTLSTGESDIYLDNNATTPLLPEVVEAMLAVMKRGALNPSSAHSRGEEARRLLATAREEVASLVGCHPDEVYFTGGATESNHIVLRHLAVREGGLRRLLVSSVEHSSIHAAAEALPRFGVDVRVLPVDEHGRIDLGEVAPLIVPGATMICVQWANNETGVIQPMEELSALCRSQNTWLHTDAVQAVGKLPLDLRLIPVDSLALSGHKFHGPTGVGGLVVREGRRIAPLLPAGDQERGVRPGTHDLAGIVGMGHAARLRVERHSSATVHMQDLRDRFEARLLDSGAVARVNGGQAPRLPNTTNLMFRDVEGDALMARLDRAGVICSQSSACTAMRPEPSYVLRAMGLSEEEAFRSVRFSFSESNTAEEAMQAADTVIEVHRALHRFHLATMATGHALRRTPDVLYP